MSDVNSIWCEFVVVGSDYTPILSCLDKCSVEHDTSLPEENDLFEKIKAAFLLSSAKKKKKDNESVDIHYYLKKEEFEKAIAKKELTKFKDNIPGIDSYKARIYLEKHSKRRRSDTDLAEIRKIEESSKRISEERFLALRELFDDCIDKAIKNTSEINQDFYRIIRNSEDILQCKFSEKDLECKNKDHPLCLLFKAFAEKLSLVDDEDELIVGRRPDSKLKASNCNLYSSFNGKHCFGNIVGTVRKVYSLREFFSLYKPEEITDEMISANEDKNIAIKLEIRSRFDINYARPPFFLLEMLTQGNLILNKYEVSSQSVDAIFDCLLLWRLKKYLINANQKGFFRAYNTFSENGTRVKGTIDIINHIKINMGLDNGRIAYTYREKSINNYLNHLILEAYSHLKEKYTSLVINNIDNDYKVRRVINILKSETQYPQYSRRMLIQKNASPISHPFYIECEELRRTCLQILRGDSISLFSGDSSEVSGILYYVPDLWEEYLESRFEQYRVESQMEINIFSDRNLNGFKTKTYPDFVFKNDNNVPFMVFDAKYKPGWFNIHAEGRLYSNYLHDYDKCIRDMNSINAYATGTIFPYNAEVHEDVDLNENEIDSYSESINVKPKKSDIIRHAISSYNSISSFYTVPISIPAVNKKMDYPEWHEIFSREIEKQINGLFVIIQKENEKHDGLSKLLNGFDSSLT